MRVLYLTHRLPYAPNRGDRIRAYHTVRYLAQRHQVDLVSLVHDDEEAARIGDLRPFVDSVTTARVRRAPATQDRDQPEGAGGHPTHGCVTRPSSSRQPS
jgi:hypothetical protein